MNDDEKMRHSVYFKPKISKVQKTPKLHKRVFSDETAKSKIAMERAGNKIKDAKSAKKQKRVVFLDMKIKRISKIDTTEETFRAYFHWYFTWLATQKEVENYYVSFLFSPSLFNFVFFFGSDFARCSTLALKINVLARTLACLGDNLEGVRVCFLFVCMRRARVCRI